MSGLRAGELAEDLPYGPGNPDYQYDGQRADEDALIAGAFQDILAGRFDTDTVHDAMRLGHRAEYHELKDALHVAESAARHAGAV